MSDIAFIDKQLDLLSVDKQSDLLSVDKQSDGVTNASTDAMVESKDEKLDCLSTDKQSNGDFKFETIPIKNLGRVAQRIEDLKSLPIPAEIKDLEDYLKDDEIKPMTEKQRQQYTPFVKDLVDSLDASWLVKSIQIKMIELRRKHRCCPRYSDLIEIYRQEVKKGTYIKNRYFERIIRKKFMRTSAGVAVITLLLGPGKFSCPHDCHYCPNDPAIARSYLLDEPAVRRGFKHGWDPIRQFNDCAERLYRNGHDVTKVEVIIEGGTFGSYPVEYIEGFFRDFYYAANTWGTPTRDKLSLSEELHLNETSECALIGITIETRPDWVNKKQIQWFRRLGVTRVQIGIQHLDDRILDIVNRQCPTKKTIRAIRMLKRNCFKISAHMMPDLPGSSYEMDMEMFKYLFSDQEEIQVDFLKVYPTMTTDYTVILQWYREGIYHPYAKEDGGKWIDEVMHYVSLNAPEQMRLERLGRDIPNKYIKAGLDRINIRQEVNDKIKADGLAPKDIRGREVKGQKFDPETAKLWVKKYRSSGGNEYFISYENTDKSILYGFVRLRLDDPNDSIYKDQYFDCLHNAALIRELHVYGELVHQDTDNTGYQTQHLGVGRFLMSVAEEIAWNNNFKRCAVISGIGVRRYYRKLGYELENTFMVKTLTNQPQRLAPHIAIIAAMKPKTEINMDTTLNTHIETSPTEVKETQIISSNVHSPVKTHKNLYITLFMILLIFLYYLLCQS